MSFLILTDPPRASLTGTGHRRPTLPHLPAVVGLWRERQRTRRQLRGLDDRLLADVGLTREQQRAECAKAPWQP